jgi:hypothetical protein
VQRDSRTELTTDILSQLGVEVRFRQAGLPKPHP